MSLRNKIEQLIKNAKDYDPDKRYMAASDLCNELLKEQEEVDQNLQRSICGVFLEHLDDQSVEVQGNAVRCIKRTVSKIHESQVGEVIDKLGQCLTGGKPELIDIYSTCLKGLIGDVPDTYATKVIDTMLPILLMGIKSTNVQLQEEATDTLTELIRRFAPQMQGNTDRSDMLRSLMSLLYSDKSSVRKKATQCIGVASLILHNTQLQHLVNQIKDTIRSARNLQEVYTFVQALSSIIRSVGHKLSGFLGELVPMLLPLCSIEGLSLDSPDIDFEHEKIEVCLAAIESLIRRCPKEINSFISQIYDVAVSLVHYDPNYSYVDEPIDEDDDWGSDFDGSDAFSADAGGDDSSWKVRRAAVHVLQSIIKTKPEVVAGLYDSLVSLFLNKFKEHEENVKLDIFKAFSSLFKSVIITSDDTDTEELPTFTRKRSCYAVLSDQVPSIIDHVLKELNTKNMKVRQGLTQLILEMSSSLAEKMAENLIKLKDEIIKNLEDKNNSHLRMDTLIILERIYKLEGKSTIQNEVVADFLPHIKQGVFDEYFKISAQCLKLVGIIVKALPNNDQVLSELVPAVMDRLSITDIDQEVKQASIYSASIILATGRTNANINKTALQLITERMKNENTRLACLKGWEVVATASNPVSLDNLEVVEAAIAECVKLLKKNQRGLKVSVLESVKAILSTFSVSEGTVHLLAEELADNISANDLHVAQFSLELINIILQNNSAVALPNLEQLLNAMNELARSRLVQGSSLNRLAETYAMFVQQNRIAPQYVASHLSSSLDSLTRQSFGPLSRCIAAACLAGPSDFREEFLNECLRNLPSLSEASMLAALCIGEIGKHLDLSGRQDITNSMIALFDQGNEDLKYCSSVALGSLAVGNLNIYLQVIFQQFNVASHQYLLLIALKEVIDYKFLEMQNYLNRILPILLEHAQNPEESIRGLVSECLGKLFLVASNALEPEIVQKLGVGSDAARTTVAFSMKYAANNKLAKGEQFENIIPRLIECLQAQDVNLRRSALISLNAIAHNLSASLKPVIQFLMTYVYALTVVDQSLIRKVDLGPFVHQIDDGLMLRKAAFSLIETILVQLPDKVDLTTMAECLIQGLDDISEEIQIQALHTISKLASWGISTLLVHIEKLGAYFNKTIEAQQKLIKGNQEIERAHDMLRACFKCIDALEHHLESDSPIMSELSSKIEASTELAKIMHLIKRQREAWFTS